MKFRLLKESAFKFYTDGQKTIKIKDGDEIPNGFYPGRTFNSNPWNKGLTASTDERVRDNIQKSLDTKAKNGYYKPWNKGLTKETDSRIKGMSGENNPMYGKHPDVWNKGLTKETDERVRKISDSNIGKDAWNKGKHIQGHPHSEETKEKIRQVHLDPRFKQQRYTIMKNNGTLFTSDSKAENDYYQKLKSQYGEDGVVRQYFDKDRYPYKCDFYIPSEDKFIEVHGNWTHGGMPFDLNNELCKQKLATWQEKAQTSKYYENAIYTWTDLDVRKLQCAKDNNLNFEAIYY